MTFGNHGRHGRGTLLYLLSLFLSYFFWFGFLFQVFQAFLVHFRWYFTQRRGCDNGRFSFGHRHHPQQFSSNLPPVRLNIIQILSYLILFVKRCYMIFAPIDMIIDRIDITLSLCVTLPPTLAPNDGQDCRTTTLTYSVLNQLYSGNLPLLVQLYCHHIESPWR